MFFISLLLLLKFGKTLFLKRIFLTYFRPAFLTIQLQKFLQKFQVIANNNKKKYVPARSMWLNRVFIDLANTDEKQYLTIDCSNVSKKGPG